MSDLFNSISAQRTYNAWEAPDAPKLGVADAFSVGYQEQFTQTRFNAENLISSQVGENVRYATELGLNLPRLRTKDGNALPAESMSKELTKYFAGEDADVSTDSVNEYESFVREAKKKYPQAKVESLASRWQSFSAAAQQVDSESKDASFGLSGGIGYLAGSMAGFMSDPVNAATSAVGAAPIAGARTLTAVGGAMLREGAMQAGVEAGQEAAGQATFRKDLGLDGSLGSSAQRVGGAFLFGGLFRGAAEGVMGGAGKLIGKEIGVAPEIDPSTPTEFLGAAFKKKEVPAYIDLQAAERAKHADLALWADPTVAKTVRGEASVLQDLEAVRKVADDWSGPPLWSRELLNSAVMPAPSTPGFRIGGETVDINAAARQIDPDTFRVYDDLIAQRESLKQQIETARGAGPATVEFAKAISAANDKVVELTDALGNRKLKPKERKELEAQRDAAMTERDTLMAAPRGEADSPAAAALREEFSKVDYKIRDMAPSVTRAVARARGEFVASKKLNAAVKDMVTNRANKLDEANMPPSTAGVADEAESMFRRKMTPDEHVQARMGSTAPEGDETMADTLIRVAKTEGDTFEDGLDGFVGSMIRALDDKAIDKITIGKTELSLNDKVFIPADGVDGGREGTVRELLEELRRADENEKAIKTCLI